MGIISCPEVGETVGREVVPRVEERPNIDRGIRWIREVGWQQDVETQRGQGR